jgi:septum formation protein
MFPGDRGIRRLILASASPRRRQLLSLLGVPFVIKAAAVDETPLKDEAPSEMVLRISRAKASAMPDIGPEELVVAADTTVVLDGQVLGKPADAEEAVQMLRRLRGRPHLVYTGLALWHPASRRMIFELGQSQVWMRAYAEEEIAGYVASGDALDKAGAYAIQDPGFAPVARVEGCWLNVMGLPLCHLSRGLTHAGVVVPATVPRACQAFSQRGCAAWPEIVKNRISRD